MRKLDSSIYGMDDNALAHSISGDALQSGGAADTHGPITQDKANAKGNVTEKGGVIEMGRPKADGRAKTSGNHGSQD